MKTIIGSIKIKGQGRHFENNSEVACWGHELSWPDQTAELFLSDRFGGELTWRILGMEYSTYTPSLFGGVIMNNGNSGEHPTPTPYTKHCRAYAYQINDLVQSGAVALNDDWEIEHTELHHRNWCCGYVSIYDETQTFKWRYDPCKHLFHVTGTVGILERQDTEKIRLLIHRDNRGRLERGYTPEATAKHHYRPVKRARETTS